MLKTHQWDAESPESSKPCKDGETKGHLVSPVPAGCFNRVCQEEGLKEGTAEHGVLEKKKMGFQCQVVPGELMHAMVAAQPNIA